MRTEDRAVFTASNPVLPNLQPEPPTERPTKRPLLALPRYCGQISVADHPEKNTRRNGCFTIFILIITVIAITVIIVRSFFLEVDMAKSLVTQERVFEVADGLTERGEEPGILSVQAAIGGGSYSTVKRYLDVWKDTRRQRRAQITLPDAAVDRLMDLGRNFWALLEERTAREVDQIRAGAKEESAGLEAQVRQAEQAIAKLELDKEQLEQLAAERESANQALQAEIHVQRERATAAESKAAQLEARIADLKAELDRALKQTEAERQAASGARQDAQTAALEGASLKGELAALRGSKN